MVESKSAASQMRIAMTYFIVVFLGLITLLPLMNVVAISFSSDAAIDANKVYVLPVNFTSAAYEKLLSDKQFFTSFRISVLRVVLSLVLHLTLTVLMAYPLSKSDLEFKPRKVYLDFIIFSMLFSGGMIPTYLVVRNLGLLNKIWALVLPGAVGSFDIILTMNFFKNVPKALEESAMIDGANPLQVLVKIMIPVSMPVIATIALFTIVGNWNDFFSGMIYNTKIANYPLMTYIQGMVVDKRELAMRGAVGKETMLSNENLNSAKIVVAVIPLLLIYPYLQRYLITGIVMGSVKE